MADHLHPEDAGATLGILADAAERGAEQYLALHRSRLRDGSYIRVEAIGRLLCGADGELSEIHCVVRDITERQRGEQALCEGHSGLKLLFTSGYTADVIADRGVL